MAQETGDSVPVPLSEDATLFIPTADQKASYAAILQAKYGDKEGPSQWQAGEPPEQYMDRLLKLYPSKDQQTYIRTLANIARIDDYGMWALQGYALGQEVDPKVQAVYPAALNTAIMGMGLDKDKSDKWVVKMTSEEAATVVAEGNSTVFLLERYEKEKVTQARALLQDIVLGKAKLDDAPLASHVKIAAGQLTVSLAGTILGEAQKDELIRQTVEGHVTAEWLGLSTDVAVQGLKQIANYVNEPFYPIKVFADFIEASCALNDLDIYPHIGLDLWKAFDSTVVKPPK